MLPGIKKNTKVRYKVAEIVAADMTTLEFILVKLIVAILIVSRSTTRMNQNEQKRRYETLKKNRIMSSGNKSSKTENAAQLKKGRN